jgi:Flp pilus assembly protein TadG
MARVTANCTRGAMYVEFLIAFMPLFLLFLAICQFSLLGVARIVVSHAAVSAVRAAVVVLEDDPSFYRNVCRGILSDSGGIQKGQRMKPIRSAATEPLKILAPGAQALTAQANDISSALTPMTLTQSNSSDVYADLLTQVTLHDTLTNARYAAEPIPPDATVTARVVHYYQCEIPLVRRLACKPLSAPSSPPDSSTRESLVQALRSNPAFNQYVEGRYFYVLTAKATLPNQGAGYYQAGGDRCGN